MVRIVLALLAGLALAPAAYGTHTPQGRCDGNPSLGIIEISGGTADTTFYVDDRNVVTGNGIWVYLESNGIWTGTDPAHDLQRGSYICMYCEPETCVDDPEVEPDMMVI